MYGSNWCAKYTYHFIVIFTYTFISSVCSGQIPSEIPGSRISVEAGDLVANRATFISTCNSASCFDNQDETSVAADSFCDTPPTRVPGAEGSCPGPSTTMGEGPPPITDEPAYGCARFAPDGASPVLWRMDDPQKLCVRRQCAGSRPCFAGHARTLEPDGVWTQGATLELPAGSPIVLESGSDFHFWAALKTLPGTERACIAGSALHHLCVDPDGSLFLRLDSWSTALTPPGAVPLGSWISVEVSRSGGALRVWIDGEEKTQGQPIEPNESVVIGYLMSAFKGDKAFTGRLAGLWLYDRVLSDSERASLHQYLADTFDVGPGSQAGRLRFDPWVDRFVVQRRYATADDGAGSPHADFEVSGTVDGPATAVEARVIEADTSTPVTPWTIVDPSPQQGFWSGTLPAIPQGGWYRIEARRHGDPSIATISAHRFGVGMVLAAIGQSNMVKMFTEDQADGSVPPPFAEPHELTRRLGYGEPAGYTYVRPRSADIPVTWGPVTGSGGIRLANQLVAELGVPVLILDFALDWTGLLQHWNDFDGFIGWSRFADALDQMTGLEAVLWHQGAYDAHEPYAYENDVVTVDEYMTGLDALYQRIVALRPEIADGGPLPFLVAIQNRGVYDDEITKDDAYHAVRWAQKRWIAERAHGFSLGETSDIDLSERAWAGKGHFWAAGYEELADRYTGALLSAIGQPGWTDGLEGGRLSHAVLFGKTIQIHVEHDQGSHLQLRDPSSPVEGFTITDGDWTVDLGSGPERHELEIVSAVLSDDQVGNWIELELAEVPSGPVRLRYLYGQNVFHYKSTDAERRQNGNTLYDDFGYFPGRDGVPVQGTVQDLLAQPVAGLTISTETLTVAEGGGAEFAVRLDATPTQPVVVSLATHGDPDIRLSGPTTLTFTPGDALIDQIVTLVADLDADSQSGRTTIRLTAEGYQSRRVEAAELDSDPFLNISGADRLAVSELDGQTSFEVSLGLIPSSPVRLTINSLDSERLSVSPATLDFSPSNWSVPQTVTVQGHADSGSNSGRIDIVLAVDATASDDLYDLLPELHLPVDLLDLDSGLQLHWPLDDRFESGAGPQLTSDISGFERHGRIGSRARVDLPGVDDGAIGTVGAGGVRGDADDGIESAPFPVENSEALSVAFWYRLDADKHDGYLFHWGGTYNAVNAMSAFLDVGQGMRIRVHDALDDSSVLEIGPTGFDQNGWHHLAIVKDETGSRIYFDGEPAGQSPMGSGSLVPSDGFGLGMNELGTYGSAADFDDVRAYDRALTVGEVQALYDASANVPLKVTLDPADGRWAVPQLENIGGEPLWRLSGTDLDVPLGSWTVVFSDIPGRLTPPDLTVIAELGRPLNIQQSYAAEGQGRLRVHLSPTAAADGSGRWSLSTEGPPFHSSGDEIVLPTGTYTVQFTDVASYQRPADLQVTISENETSEVWGDYVAEGDVDPILHLRLDETSGPTAIDSSGYERHGVYGSAVQIGGLGIAGASARTTGPGGSSGSASRGVSVPRFADDAYDAATVSLWYRLETVHDGYLFNWGGSYNKADSISAYLDVDTGLRIRVHDADDSSSVGQVAPPDFADSRWHHLVIVKSRTGSDVYFDGVHRLSHPMGDGPLTPQRGLGLGMNEIGTYGLDASFDDVRLWSRALTSDQIEELYASSTHARIRLQLSPPDVRDLGARWRPSGDSRWYESGEVATVPIPRAPGDTGPVAVDLTFSSLTGWTRPADLTLTLNAGEAVESTAAYESSGFGSLTVWLEPSAALPAQAAWRLQSDPDLWQPSGATTPVAAGSHTVTFAPVAGWIAPDDADVTVGPGGSTNLTATYSPDIGPNPILHLQLDDPPGGMAVDSSGYGRHGSVGADVSVRVPGVGPSPVTAAMATAAPGAGSGDLEDGIQVADFAPDDAYPEATVSLWYRLHADSGDGYLFHWGGSHNDTDAMSVYLDAGRELRVRVHDAQDSSSVLRHPAASDYGRFDDDGWHHLVVVKSTSGSELYFDGSFQAAHPMGRGLLSPALGFGLGTNEIGTYGLTADFDDVRIWERALDASEITELFEASAYGRLRVLLEPEEFESVGGWRLAVDPLEASRAHDEWLVLEPGPNTVIFDLVNGQAPEEAPATIAIGRTTTVIGDYVGTLNLAPLVHLTLDESTGSTAIDASGLGNHGTYGSRMRLDLGGVHGRGAQTAGIGAGDGVRADGLEVPLVVDGALDELSVAFWYRLPAEAHDGYLFNWGGTHTDDHAISAYLDVDSELRIRVREGGDHSSQIGLAPAGFNDTAWHHLAVVKDENGSSIYFDGSLAAQSPFGAGHILPVDGFCLGMNQTGRYGVESTFDDIRLYDRALTADEVAELYAEASVPEGFGGAYRTVDELHSELEQLASTHDSILELVDFGDSWAKAADGWITEDGDFLPGDDLLAARVTRLDTVDPETPRPVFVLAACLHAREIATPEIAMRWLGYLLEEYDRNADVTWLVDHHEIWILPMVNPDGRRMVELGASSAHGSRPWPWRKNVRPGGSCAWPPTGGDTFGVDINRNFPYQWGVLEGVGGSSDPCDSHHRGTGGGSEPETQAIMSLVSSLIPDQRQDPSSAAPADATGLFIQLHSPFRTVAWPWAHGAAPSPEAEGLEAIGRKLASFNGYRADQAYDAIYPMSGTADDWVHGELGAAAFLLEVGEGLMPAFNRVDNVLWPENRDLLLYAAKIAGTPYATARGPEISDLVVTPGSAGFFELLAVVDDSNNGGNAVAEIELYIDEIPGSPGASPWSSPTAVDGSFDQPLEVISTVIDPSDLTPGRHTVYLKARDDAGNWGAASAAFFEVD